jgi:hypothetical protein
MRSSRERIEEYGTGNSGPTTQERFEFQGVTVNKRLAKIFFSLLQVQTDNEQFVLSERDIFRQKSYKGNEEALQKAVVNHSKRVFGDDTIYFDLKKRVASNLRPRVTDGLLLDLTDSKQPRFYIVEYELSSHDMERVAVQLIGFATALKDKGTISDIMDVMYPEVRADSRAKRLLKNWWDRANRGIEGVEEPDLHFLLNFILRQGPGVLVVIDRVTQDVLDAIGERCNALLEFRTFEHGTKTMHLFDSLHPPSFWKDLGREVGKRIKLGREMPEIKRSWEARLTWASPQVRSLVTTLIQRLHEQYGEGVFSNSKYKWYAFYLRSPTPAGKKAGVILKRQVAVIMIGRKTVNFAFRVNPEHFKLDDISHTVKGFFFPSGMERRVPVTQENLNSVVRLAKTAYESWVD